MTNQEFSNEFDVLYNNIMSNQAPGLDEYEKSVFLTKAQYEILKNYVNPKGNKYGEGFDGNPKRQIDFSKVTRTSTYGKETNISGNFNKNAIKFQFPKDALIILNETVRVSREGTEKYLTVVPISTDEYDRLMSKPYRWPLKNQAWRLLLSGPESAYVEVIVGPYDDKQEADYIVRYVKRPYPIILTALPDGLSIDGYTGSDSNGAPVMVGTDKVSTMGIESELDPELHQEILQRAIELAKAAYTGDINSEVQMGQRSE